MEKPTVILGAASLVDRGDSTLELPMTPAEQIFNDGIELALQRTHCGDRPEYWDGYLTGLMRAFFGSLAVSDTLHGTLSSPDRAGDAALGYRDAYQKLAGCRDAPTVGGMAGISGPSSKPGLSPAQTWYSTRI